MDNQPIMPDLNQLHPSRFNKKKLGWWLLAGLALAAISGFAFWQTLLEPATEPQVRTATVNITAEGFQPATLKVQPNTEVTWVNTDTDPHQIAANPHPEHSQLPGLVSGTIGAEGNYSYTFEEPGEYDYHDELDPLTNGTVVVEE